MQNTEAGFLSRIWYLKAHGLAPIERLIEPRSLADGLDGLMVQALQILPERGPRRFYPSRITRVARSDQRLSPEQQRKNSFCSGEVRTTGHVRTRVFTDQGGLHLVAELSTGGAPREETLDRRSLIRQPWFAQYVGLVRESVLDFCVDQNEIAKVRTAQLELGLSEDQILAVHSFVLGETLIDFAHDASLGKDDRVLIAQMGRCLSDLGGSPMAAHFS